MATNLTIRAHFSEPSSAERFEALAKAVDDSPLASQVWSGLDVVVRRPLQYRLRHEGKLAPDVLRAMARKADLAADESMGSSTSLRCWRRDDGGMVESWIVAAADVWREDYGRLNEEDLRMGGTAAVTLSHAAPFVVDVSGQDPAYNAKVEVNLENLMELMIHLANALQPDALKLFDDQGLRLPINCHAAYFRRAEIVLDDIALLRQVWDSGLPLHRVDPLRTYGSGSQDVALHLWRTAEQRTELWRRLSAAVEHTPSVDDVNAVVASGHFDTLTKGDSFFVLDYPHFVNSFVAPFYLEILEHAGMR